MRLVALSGKRRSGKTTLGDLLVGKDFIPVSLAAPLKALCRLQFGLTVDQTDGIFKEQPTQYKDAATGAYLTPRNIMIRTGQFYRSIDPDFWVKKLFEFMKASSKTSTFVVTDVRFKNEMAWMQRQQALCVRLERDEEFTGPAIDDPSETELDDYKSWDIFIPKSHNRDMNDLQVVADLVYDHLSSRV